MLALSAGLSPLFAADAPQFPLANPKETVADYAKRTGLAPTVTLDLGGGVTWEGELIPAGTFVMGSPKGEAPGDPAEEQQHKVTLTKPFYMGKYELTQKQYEKVTGTNPSPTKGDDLPVCNVPPVDAESFCDKMSALVKRSVKLPTEAQWEYACRAGTTTAYYNGDSTDGLDKIAWFGANSGNAAHPVGQKMPNAWGLYDMSGNLREIVHDFYNPAPQGDATDPTGPATGDPKNHVVRGAGFSANAIKAGNCRSASRRPTENLVATGFRVMLEVDKK